MAKTIHCRTCGGIAWGRTESYGDDRCDDCINRSERLAEIEADINPTMSPVIWLQQSGRIVTDPPEFKEGRKAYITGKSKYENPYTVHNPMPDSLEVHENTAEMLWRQGWEAEKKHAES